MRDMDKREIDQFSARRAVDTDSANGILCWSQKNYFCFRTHSINLPILSWELSFSTVFHSLPSSFSSGTKSWMPRWHSRHNDMVWFICSRVNLFLNHLFLWHFRGIRWCSVVPVLVTLLHNRHWFFDASSFLIISLPARIKYYFLRPFFEARVRKKRNHTSKL